MLPFALLGTIRQNGIRRNGMTPSFGGPDLSELYCFIELVLKFNAPKTERRDIIIFIMDDL